MLTFEQIKANIKVSPISKAAKLINASAEKKEIAEALKTTKAYTGDVKKWVDETLAKATLNKTPEKKPEKPKSNSGRSGEPLGR